MPTKIRILLFTMAASAGLIVFSVFTNVKNISNLGANIGQITNVESDGLAAKKNNSNAKIIERSDIDKDGLFDKEEPLYRTDPLNKDTDGDGFLDGEEVATGCSPISASPKDCNLKPGLDQANINLTDYFASLIVGGFLSNDLNKSNPNFQNYRDSLAEEASQIQKTVLYVDESDLNIETTAGDSKRANQEYLNNLETVLNKYFFKKSGQAKIDKISDFDFSPYLNDLDKLRGELIKLRPPPDRIKTHKRLVKLILELKAYFANLGNQEKDPVKTLLTLKNTQRLLDDYEKLMEEIYGNK
ncbi:MAG: hypothetical protein AAB338_02490 [Patescibacteria group bacterium]